MVRSSYDEIPDGDAAEPRQWGATFKLVGTAAALVSAGVFAGHNTSMLTRSSALAAADSPAPSDDVAAVPPPAAAADDDDGASAGEWYVYKIAAPIRPGRGFAVADFVDKYLCPKESTYPMSLGCDATRTGGFYKVPWDNAGDFDNQLHFVDGDKFDGVAVAASWTTRALELAFNTTDVADVSGSEVYRGEAVHFSAFMHSKVQLFVPDLAPFAARLDKGGVAYLKRTSSLRSVAAIDDDDAAVGTTAIAHLGVPLEGRIIELVGPLSSLPDAAQADYAAWDDSAGECAACHALAGGAYEDYVDYYEAAADTATWDDDEANDDGDEAAADARSQPMLVGIHVSRSADEPASHDAALWRHLETFTGAAVAHSSHGADGACGVASVSWGSMPLLRVKYVRNGAARGADELAAFDAAVAETHAKYLACSPEDGGGATNGTCADGPPAWARWDNFLDTHIGMMSNSFMDDDACAGKDAGMRRVLEGDSVRVAMRNAGGVHFYSGYNGSMAWEYNLGMCQTEDLTNVCGCIGTNNEYEYMRLTNASMCHGAGDYTYPKSWYGENYTEGGASSGRTRRAGRR